VFAEGDEVADRVRDATGGRGADAVIECTGIPEVWQLAPTCARRGGTVVLFGGCPAGTRVTFDTYRLHYDGVKIASPFHFRPRDVEAAYRLLSRRDIDWSALVSARARLEEVPAVFERLGEGKEMKIAILPHES
jgi:L-iditol 2-dehydrogenase